MTEAKVPDNKSDWKSIDIFLFSNGQRYSPPRKYHIVTDQLDWWKATLNFLAKSQYGSMQNMVDLYTIDGQKIETPMQLSHNTAYVAVAPPDLFIDASYEKYLIKATRSWEKGQIRRSSNTAVVRPEEIEIENDKSDYDIRALESIGTKIIRDGSVTLKTIVASMVDNQPSVIVKPEVNSNKQTPNTNNLNPVNLTDKTQKPAIVKNPGIVKKKLPSPPTTRKPSLKRKDSVKINMEIAKDRPSLDTNNSKGSSRNKIYKPLHKPRDSVPETTLTKVEEKMEEEKSSSFFKLNSEKSFLTKDLDSENVKDEEDVMNLNYYLNNYSQKPSTAVTPDINFSGNVNRQGGAHELFDESSHFISSNCQNIENEAEIKTETSLIPQYSTNNQPLGHEISSPIVSVASKKSKSENDAALNNKEGTVNLKLNIEIWNYANEAKPSPINKESPINLKPEKGSQVNIEEKSKHDTLGKTIAKDIDDDGNHKVIIVKCTCLNQESDITKNNLIPVNIGNNNFLVFLPVLKLNEDQRCECKENTNKSSASANSSAEYPVKRATSCLSLYKGRSEKIVSHSELTSKNNSIEMKLETNTIHDKNGMTSVKRKSVAIREDQEMFPHLDKLGVSVNEPGREDLKVLVHLLEPNKSEFNSREIIVKKESIGILHKSANKFTQTEWCDVLLEVKLQDDGHYSLRMPPLEMLKNYKL